MPSYFDDPITVALDAQGNLRDINEVSNGLACGCFCPAPGCHARLIARNGGTKLRPHFAHQAGSSCQWALESSVTLLAKAAVERCGTFYFPGWCVDERRKAPGVLLPVADVSEENVEGWDAPLLRLTCVDGEEKVQRLVIFAWHDPCTMEQQLCALETDTVVVYLNELYQSWKYACERHSNKAEFVRQLQSQEEIIRLVVQDVPQKEWLISAAWSQANQEAMDERRRAWEDREEKRRIEQEKLEAQRAEREAERQALAQAEQDARQRVEEQRQRRADARMAALEDFCACNGLNLLKVSGAGRLVDCPVQGRKIGAERTDYGCRVCASRVRDFGTHIACAATSDDNPE